MGGGSGYLVRYALSQLRDQALAEEAVQEALLAALETKALEHGCCKLTLEVLSGNSSAIRAYEREGFGPFALDPAFGTAVFMQKKL